VLLFLLPGPIIISYQPNRKTRLEFNILFCW